MITWNEAHGGRVVWCLNDFHSCMTGSTFQFIWYRNTSCIQTQGNASEMLTTVGIVGVGLLAIVALVGVASMELFTPVALMGVATFFPFLASKVAHMNAIFTMIFLPMPCLLYLHCQQTLLPKVVIIEYTGLYGSSLRKCNPLFHRP